MQKFRTIFLLATLPMLAMTFYSCHAQKKSIIKGATTVVDTFESEKNKKGDPLPEFSFITAQGKEMSTNELNKDRPVILVLFNPSCGHCQKLLEQVRDNISIFKEVDIIFLTGKPLQPVLFQYVKNVKVDNMKEILVVSDNSDITLKIFEYYGIPQIMLYNKDHNLEYIYYKEASNKQMLKHLRK